MKLKFYFLLFALLLSIKAIAQCSIGANFTGADTRSWPVGSDISLLEGQSFRANSSGFLLSVELDLSADNSGCANSNINVEINILNGSGVGGSELASQVFSIPVNFSRNFEPFVFDSPTQIVGGNMYTITANVLTDQSCGAGEPELLWYFAFPTSYFGNTGGAQYLDGNLHSQGNTNYFKTCVSATLTPEVPIVSTPVVYSQNEIATALTATPGQYGTGLLWYATELGGSGSTTAPIPNTATIGSVFYWVSSTNTYGYESARTRIEVKVVLPATHLNFGAANDYVDCGNNPSLQITGNTITLEAYVKFNTFGSEHWLGNIINKAAPNSSGYMLRAGGNGAVNFVVANLGWYELTTPDNAITLDTWYHIAGVYNGTTSKIYIDGIEVASTNIAMGNIGNSNFNVNLGRDPQDTVRGLDASLDEVRIWNVARNETQIISSKDCELQGNETGLVAYYKFNQGIDAEDNTSEASLLDATSNANNGTLTNFDLTGTTSNWLGGSLVTTGSIIPSAPTVTTPLELVLNETASPLTATIGSNGTGLMWYATETDGTGTTTAPTPDTSTLGSTSYWVSSTNDSGCESERTEIVVNVYAPATHLNFDGVNDYITLPTESNFDFTTEMTVEFWMNSNYANPEQWDGLITKGDDSWRLHLNSSGTVNFACTGTTITAEGNSTTVVTDGNWHHIAATLANNTVRLYIDGVEEFTTAAPEALNNSPFPVAIGQNLQQVGRFYSGNMEDVRIWNIARTAEQINGSKNCELQGNETGLVAYYKSNQGIDAADNTSETTVIDETGVNNGTLINFGLTGTISNWLAGSPVTTGSIIPSVATGTTSIIYELGDTATALTATTGGTGLWWYTTETGGSASTEAPTPDTSTVGSTSYWVTSTNDHGCESDRLEIVVLVEDTLGMEQPNVLNNISIYPNPTNGSVSVSLPNAKESQVTVYDINGRLLLNQTNLDSHFKIDLSVYEAGIYLIKLQINQNEIIKRIVKH